jgi:hypothetical protein
VKIPRYSGRDADNPDRPEIEHFANCPHCGALIELGDLGQVLNHLDGEVPEDRSGMPDPPPQERALSWSRYSQS